MELGQELKKEVGSVDAWLDQVGNWIYATTWALGTWLMLSFLWLVPTTLWILWNVEWTPAGQEEFKSVLPTLACLVMQLNAFLVLLFGIPRKLRNIFVENATRRVTQYEAISKEVADQTTAIDSLLLTYGLISEEDIEARAQKALMGRSHEE